MTVSSSGSVHGTLPPGIPISAINGRALAEGKSVSLSHGNTVFAAADLLSFEGTILVIWVEVDRALLGREPLVLLVGGRDLAVRRGWVCRS